MNKIPVIECDVMLLGWSETHNGGAKITLQLADIDELEPFKTMTIKKGKIAGQLLKACFVEVDGNGEPVPPDAPKKTGGKFPDGYCGLAVKWCGEIDFGLWLEHTFSETFDEARRTLLIGDRTVAGDIFSAWMVKKICGVSSRKELDTSDRARAAFDTIIRQPYMTYRKEHGLE